MMNWLKEVFKTEKPIIAMCHLQALPGDSGYDQEKGMEWVIEKAREDLHALQDGAVSYTHLMLHEKKQIAKLAASFVHEGDTILLDSGTTTYYLASELSDIPNLTVITYDLFIGGNLALHPTSTMIVTGGIRRQGYNNCLLYTSSGRRSGEQNYRGEEQSAGRYGIWTELH